MTESDRSSEERRARAGWVMFDWATQPFYTLVVTFLFAPYFASVFVGDAARGQWIWGVATAAAGAVVALGSPILGATVDARGGLKGWIALCSLLMVAGLAGLWFAEPGQAARIWPIAACFAAALVGAELATVLTNAVMPRLSVAGRLGRLSGTGWAVGYVGGLVSLVVMVGLVIPDPATGKTLLGLPPLVPLDAARHEGERLVGPFSAAWYLLFALPFFLYTPNPPAEAGARADWRTGLARLLETLRRVGAHRDAALLLVARMLYADGLAAIFAFGGIYGAGVFGWGATELGAFGVVLTIAGAVGAFAGGGFDDRFGGKTVILISLAVLVLASIGTLSVDGSHVLFWLEVPPPVEGDGLLASPGERAFLGFAAMIGIVSGPIQAASRSLFARLSPPDRLAEFFGLFAFSGKVTSFAAPAAIAALTYLSESQRIGIAAALPFLLGGMLVLLAVRAPRRGQTSFSIGY